MKKLIQKHVHTDIKRNREFINQRGHMLAFLFCALAVTMAINNEQASVNLAIAEYIEASQNV